MLKTNKRPVFLNLLQIRLPPNAIVSILHRVSGVLMVLSLPFMIYLFEMSLRSEASFTVMTQLYSQPLVSAVMILLLWAISHHFFAGIRYFLVDLEIIMGRKASKLSAIIATVAAVCVPLLVVIGGLV